MLSKTDAGSAAADAGVSDKPTAVGWFVAIVRVVHVFLFHVIVGVRRRRSVTFVILHF